MFWELYVQLCNQKNESPNAVAQKLGFSTGTVTWWKKGRHPRSTALQKIADYFGVTVDYLLGKEERPSAPEGADGSNGDLWAKICRLNAENRNKVDGYVSALLDEQHRAEIAKQKNA